MIPKLTIWQKIRVLIGMNFKDLIHNIGYARVGVSLDIHDPFTKKEVEKELDERGIKYLAGFDRTERAYTYALIKGDKTKIEDFIKWFTSTDYRYYVTKHALFDKDILTLVKQ